MKQCGHCKESREDRDFYGKVRENNIRLSSWCRKCTNESNIAHYLKRKIRLYKISTGELQEDPNIPNITSKQCNQCLIEKEINCFYIASNGANTKCRKATCIKCLRDKANKKRAESPYEFKEEGRAWRKINDKAVKGYELHKHYGLSLQNYEDTLIKQEFKCLICKRDIKGLGANNRSKANIDHEHVDNYKQMPPEEKRKYFRGILCIKCNTGLGCFDDKTLFLEAAIKYLNQKRKNRNESRIEP